MFVELSATRSTKPVQTHPVCCFYCYTELVEEEDSIISAFLNLQGVTDIGRILFVIQTVRQRGSVVSESGSKPRSLTTETEGVSLD
jgi:hypothetical protein